ncbi:MAG: HNH endonuclease [Bacteroidota bacterium]
MCEYCLSLANYSSSPFNIEHIIPITKFGTSDVENLALACSGCNQHKYNKQYGLDDTNLLARLYHPRTDNWKEHFTWNDDYTIIIGLTNTGRATVNTLKLNRFRLLNQRLIFKNMGLHPPSFTI